MTVAHPREPHHSLAGKGLGQLRSVNQGWGRYFVLGNKVPCYTLGR